MKNQISNDRFEMKNRRDSFPLSHQQKFIMMAESYVEKRTGDMNTPFAIRVHDVLDTDILEQAVNSAVKQFDVMRIVLEKTETETVQRCLKEYHYTKQVIAVKGDTAEERFQNAYNEAFHTVSQSLPLYDNVLWRVYIYKIDEDDFLIVINFHHVIVDGSAGTIFYSYLKNAYEAIADGKDIPNANSAGFLDFVMEEIAFTNSERGKKQIAYWKKELEGYSSIDITPYGSNEEKNMSMLPFLLDKKKMEEIALRENKSHFALTMLAYHIGIAKLTGKLDTEIGFSCANRLKKEYFGTMGYLSRAVQNRLTILEDLKLKDLLKLTFEKISENISAQQTSHYNDNSQFYLSYSNDMGSVKKMEFHNKPAELIKFNVKHSLNFLTVIAYDEGEKVRLIFAGDTKVFSIDFVKKLGAYIEATIETFYKNPDATYQEVNLDDAD